MNVSYTPHAESRKTGSVIGILVGCIVFAAVVIILGVKIHSLSAQAADAQGQVAQAKSETAQAQSDLDKAKAAAAQLQTQLDQAKAATAQLQTQLDQATSKLAGTQALASQAEASKAQVADLQAQLDKVRAESADLQGQLKQANDGSAQLLAQLDQAKSHSMELQARLDKEGAALAKLQPLIQKARHMPVTTSFDKGAWSAFGMKPVFMLRITSLSPDPLSVFITVIHGVGTRSQSGTIASGMVLTVDKLEAGDKVTIDSDGFDPVNLTVQ